jgi:hypothetical protein
VTGVAQERGEHLLVARPRVVNAVARRGLPREPPAEGGVLGQVREVDHEQQVAAVGGALVEVVSDPPSQLSLHVRLHAP